MALMIPDLGDAELSGLKSQAEAKVYRALRDQLSQEYLVLFQVGWILRKEHEQARDGEADFVVCHPDHGFLAIEVKGGGIGYEAETGQWFSLDRNGVRHDIKNPVSQALRAKYSILQKLTEHPRWRSRERRKVVCGHAVFFPDIGHAHLIVRSDLPTELIGTASVLSDVGQWILGVLTFWRGQQAELEPLGRLGVDLIRQVFARSFEIPVAASARLRAQEERRLRLTRDQLRVLDVLRSRRRAAIAGGAGTGKTVLALEKARRLSEEGFKTLLTCYNRRLADYLHRACEDLPNLDVMSFHQLCYHRIQEAKLRGDRDLLEEAKLTYPGKNLFDVQLPNALAYSVEIVPRQYDAIVCDEGQDFREEYWLPIELLLTDSKDSPLYVFYDENQNLYNLATTFPLPGEVFNLTTNCRNTREIHRAAYRYYQGTPVDPPDNAGSDIERIVAAGIRQQATRLHARIIDFVVREKVSVRDIIVLVGDSPNKHAYYAELTKHPLPGHVRWAQESYFGSDALLIDTVARFKGLESPIVFLWGMDGVRENKHRGLLYVGLSRAKSMCILVGTAEAVAQIDR